MVNKAILSIFVLALSISLANCQAKTLKIEIIDRPEKCTEKAKSGDTITMHYDGTLENGKPFDSSRSRNNPFKFQLGVGQVILGWDQGVPGMCLGEKRRLICPPEYAYGDKSFGDIIPANSTLVFEIELLKIEPQKGGDKKKEEKKKEEPKKEEPKKEEPNEEEHQHPDDFASVDTDKNGEISRDEMVAYIKSFQEAEDGAEKASDEELQTLVADIFQTDDTNKDGVLSKEEYMHAGEGIDDMTQGMEVEDDLRKDEL